MNKKKLAVLLIAAIVTSSNFIACGSEKKSTSKVNNTVQSSTQNNKTNESNNNVSEKVEEKKDENKSNNIENVEKKTKSDKDKNKEYCLKISEHLGSLGTDWSEISNLFKKGVELFEDKNKIMLAGRFATVRLSWEELLKIEGEETEQIKELKASLKKVRDLQEKSINSFTKGIDNIDADKIVEGTTYLNEAAKEMLENANEIIKKMNN